MHAETHEWTAGAARAAIEAAPLVGLQRLTPNGPIVIVAPHPDDESLGCGGLIAEAAAAGRRVIVALMTDGAGSHPHSTTYSAEERATLRQSELRRALLALTDNVSEVASFGAADGALAERMPQAGNWLQSLIKRTGARTLFVTWDADPHPDHQAAFAASSAAAEATDAALWAYPIWSLTLPDEATVGPMRQVVRLDIAPQQDRKRRAIGCHASQLDAAVMADPSGFLLRPDDIERHTGPSEPYLSIRMPYQAAPDRVRQALREADEAAVCL